MKLYFQYRRGPEADAINVHLIRYLDRPCGEVTAPAGIDVDQPIALDLGDEDGLQSPRKALLRGMCLATTFHLPLVVTGEVDLWESHWGQLVPWPEWLDSLERGR